MAALNCKLHDKTFDKETINSTIVTGTSVSVMAAQIV